MEGVSGWEPLYFPSTMATPYWGLYGWVLFKPTYLRLGALCPFNGICKVCVLFMLGFGIVMGYCTSDWVHWACLLVFLGRGLIWGNVPLTGCTGPVSGHQWGCDAKSTPCGEGCPWVPPVPGTRPANSCTRSSAPRSHAETCTQISINFTYLTEYGNKTKKSSFLP